jgi:methyl-accepting chemotaxis protein
MSAATMPSSPDTSTDRRGPVRKDVALAAKVGFRDRPPVACIVRNISAMGALLEFSSSVVVPEQFRIIIESEMFTADCEVRHHTGRTVGVMFTSSRLEAMARFG